MIIQGNSIEHVDGWGISATNGQAKKFKNIVIQNNEIGESELGILIRAMSGDIDEVMISNNKVRSTATAIYLVTSSNMLHAIPSVMISSNYAMGSNGIVGQRILDGRIQHFVQGNMTTSITGFEEEDLAANKIIQ